MSENRDNAKPELKAWEWWRGLKGSALEETGIDRPEDRASLARLRRAAMPVEALTVPVTARLVAAVGLNPGSKPDELERIAILAHVLAYVRTDAPAAGTDRHGFTRALGAIKRGGDKPVYSALRMARLIRPADGLDLMNQLRRAVAILDRKVDVASLARFVLRFDDMGEKARAILAYHDQKPDTDAPVA